MLGNSEHQSAHSDHHNQQHLGQQQSKTLNQHHQHQHLVNHRTSSANQKHNADDDYQDDHGMRVGHNYQAEIPQFIAFAPAPEYYEDEKAIRVWSPYNKIPDYILDEFINKAREKFHYNTEQALGMLSWHKFDLNRAYADLPNFVPYPNEWSLEDKVLFEQAYQFHEKQFGRIRDMLPDKSMASLINYYYTYKKSRTRASLVERQTRRFAAKRNTDSNGASDEEEEEEDGEENDQGSTEIEPKDTESAQKEDETQGCKGDCCNPQYQEEPRVACCLCSSELRNHSKNEAIIIDSVFDNFCEKCYLQWKLTNKKIVNDVQVGDCFYSQLNDQRQKRKILFVYSDVLKLVEGTPEQGDLMLKQLDSQVQDKKRAIQTKKQTLSQINEKIQPITDQMTDLNMDEFSDILPDYKPKKEWHRDEQQMLILGLRRYGADFSAISDVIRTKSPEVIRNFYVTQKDKLGLNRLVEEFERCKGSTEIIATVLPQEDKQQRQQRTQIMLSNLERRT